MKNTILMAVDTKGRRTITHGPEVGERDKREHFAGVKHGSLPKGVVALELWELRRRTVGVNGEEQKKRVEEEEKSVAETGVRREAAAILEGGGELGKDKH